MPCPDPRDVLKATIGTKKDERKKRETYPLLHPRKKGVWKMARTDMKDCAEAAMFQCCKPGYGGCCL